MLSCWKPCTGLPCNVKQTAVVIIGINNVASGAGSLELLSICHLSLKERASAAFEVSGTRGDRKEQYLFLNVQREITKFQWYDKCLNT